MERTAFVDPKELARVARQHGVALLLQFGSTVTGRLHPRSDVDVAVLLGQPAISLEARSNLHADLQRLFPGREVDLAVIDHADPLFLKKITEDCRLLHGDPARLAALKIYAFKRYQDHQRFLDMERVFVDKRLGAAPS